MSTVIILNNIHHVVMRRCYEFTLFLTSCSNTRSCHYKDVIKCAMASQITDVPIVCSTVSSGANQRNCQSSASLVFVRGIHRWLVNSPHKGPVKKKCFHLMTSSCYNRHYCFGVNFVIFAWQSSDNILNFYYFHFEDHASDKSSPR